MDKDIFNLISTLYLAGDLLKIQPEYPQGIKKHFLYILYTIDSLGEPVRITDIAENLLISSPNITSWVNEMEKLGLVKRQPSTEDKRVNFISIIDKGKELLNKYFYEYIEVIEEQLTLSYEDLETTIETIKEFKKILTESKNIIDEKNYLED